MDIIEKTLKFESVHKAIKNKITGTSNEIADKLGISRACLYNYIDELKSIGAEIEYNRANQHFCYKNEFNLKIVIEKNLLDENEMKNTKGGFFSTFFVPSIFLDGRILHLSDN